MLSPFNLAPPRANALRLPAMAVSVCLAAVDTILIVAALIVAEVAYAGDFIPSENHLELALFGLCFSGGFVLHMALRDGYSMRAIRNVRRILSLATATWIVTFFIVGWIAFLTKTTAEASRVSVVIFFAIGLLILLTGRSIVTAMLLRAIDRGSVIVRSVFVIVIGRPEERSRALEEERLAGIEIVGSCEIDRAEMSNSTDFEHLQTAVDAAREHLAKAPYDAIHIHMHWRATYAIAQLRTLLAQTPSPAFLFADSFIDPIVRARTLDTGRKIGFELHRAPLTWVERSVKRTFDIVVSALLLVLLSPLLVLVAAAILVESGTPILFLQHRRGFGGRPFAVYKFRSMTVTENGDVIRQAQRGDSRITPLGQVLRRLSIDELPQLVNVLRGDMSLVGPRPHAVAHDNHYNKLIATYAHRQHVKPGITGWAQVNGYRGETRDVVSMIARVDHDLHYINNWSIWLDIRILFMTLGSVLSDSNAY